jgi:RNA polymerase primary sigma factor
MNSQSKLFTKASPLSEQEEHELASAIARGDDDALHKLVEANLRLVVKIARIYVGKGLSLDDLIGEGTLGLTRAAKKFHPRHGARFGTYAAFWIKQAIGQAMLESMCLIQIPPHAFHLMRRWKSAQRALTGSLGRAPSTAEIAGTLGLSRTQARNVDAALTATTVKIASTIAGEGTRSFQLEIQERSRDADESRHERLDLLRESLGCLSRRERAVVSMRYGFDDGRFKAHREIAKKLGVSRENSRLILIQAEKKLRSHQPALAAWNETERDRRN